MAVNQSYTNFIRFNSTTDYILGFLQNILGNVISFQSIYTKVSAALTANNIPEVFYQGGRVANLLFSFNPLM